MNEKRVNCFTSLNRFHVLVLIVAQTVMYYATQQLFPIFLNYTPRFRCKLSNNTDFTNDCKQFALCKRGDLEFEKAAFQSAALEFDWTCKDNRKFLISVISMTQFFGVLIGTVLWGRLADSFGRRPITIFVLSCGTSVLAISGLSPSWIYIVISRFFIGLCIGGGITAGITFCMELVYPEQRMAIRSLAQWGNGRLISTGICYFTGNWRLASFVCALFVLPAIFIVMFVFRESPTWLSKQGNVIAMRKSEKHMAKFTLLKSETIEKNGNLHDQITKSEPVKLSTIFKNRELRKRLLVLYCIFFCASLTSFTSDLNAAIISDNIFLNQFLLAIFISLSKVALGIVDSIFPGFNRRKLHQVNQINLISCLILLSVLFTLKYQGSLLLIINIVFMISVEYTWDACYLCAIESMPTEIRAFALGSSSMMARCAALFAPLLTLLSTLWPPAAYLVLTVVASFCLVISLVFLVDTKNVDLQLVKADQEESVEMRAL